MNEAMRNLAVLLWAVCAMNNNSYASSRLVIAEEAMPSVPTVIMGEAVTPSGKKREVIVEQPENAPNPLGNPIVDDTPNVADNVPEAPIAVNAETNNSPNVIKQSAPSGELQPDEVPLPQPSTRIENELYQSGNDIVDVQAYPIEDVKEATTPNIEPTIVAD